VIVLTSLRGEESLDLGDDPLRVVDPRVVFGPGDSNEAKARIPRDDSQPGTLRAVPDVESRSTLSVPFRRSALPIAPSLIWLDFETT
jgi:hypothetical protein